MTNEPVKNEQRLQTDVFVKKMYKWQVSAQVITIRGTQAKTTDRRHSVPTRMATVNETITRADRCGDI